MDNLMLTSKVSDATLFIQMIASQAGLKYHADTTDYGTKNYVTIEQPLLEGDYKAIEKFYTLINHYRNIGLDWSPYHLGKFFRPGVVETTLMWATNSINYPSGLLYFKIITTGT